MKNNKRIIISTALFLLTAVMTAGLIIVFIPPKVEVTDISVIRADRFYSGEKETPDQDVLQIIEAIFQSAGDGSDSSCQLLSDTDDIPSRSVSDYSVVTVNMTITGRSCWDGSVPYVLIEAYDDPDGILLTTLPQPAASDIDRFTREEKCELLLYVFSGGKSEEEIVAALKSIRIRIPYTDRVHPDGSVCVGCKDAAIAFQ